MSQCESAILLDFNSPLYKTQRVYGYMVKGLLNVHNELALLKGENCKIL